MIRLMRAGDIGAAMRLKQAAGWNQNDEDWANVLALEPEGCWVGERQGEVVASTTAVCYGRDLAWIGMVLVKPEFRGRGLARGLMEHCLDWLEARGVRQVKLDATSMGRPLYEKLGFRDERMIERWFCAGGGRASVPASHLPLDPIASLDRESFGADRTRLMARLLEVFPGQGAWEADGFVLGRPGSNSYFMGPCAAREPEAARRLISALVERTSASSFFWDLFPDVPAALEVARSLGFERQRELVRMSLRPEAEPAGRPEQVFAGAGFEYG